MPLRRQATIKLLTKKFLNNVSQFRDYQQYKIIKMRTCFFSHFEIGLTERPKSHQRRQKWLCAKKMYRKKGEKFKDTNFMVSILQIVVANNVTCNTQNRIPGHQSFFQFFYTQKIIIFIDSFFFQKFVINLQIKI